LNAQSVKVPFARPLFGEEEINTLAEVIRSGWVTQGPRVAEFEKAVADYVGAKFAIATTSCTTAMHLTMYLNGVTTGDEVIMPTSTCMATANAILHTGAMPVFVDIDPRTFNLDPEKVEEAVTPRTKCIIAIHQIGLPADMDPINRIAQERGILVIEDAGVGLGASYWGKRIGGLGNPTCFSFHGRKIITTGEGGMITTNDEAFAQRARIVRSHGAAISDVERHKAMGALITQYPEMGYNYRMTDFQGAVGVEQMKRLPHILARRRELAKRYDKLLSDFDGISPPYVPDYMEHSYQSYMITFSSKLKVDRDELLRAMSARNISCRHGIAPLHQEPYFKKLLGEVYLPVSEDIAHRTLILPLFPEMTEEQQDFVVRNLKELLESR
jgi:dTDP-4-amino-4,6-dideoxygalactose transaminase